MPLENEAVRGVKTWYGAVTTNQSEDRSITVDGRQKEQVVQVTGSDYASVSFTLPAGAIIDDVMVEVVEAFALGGTTPTIIVGTDASNYIALVAEGDAEAVGTYDEAPLGTFAAPLAADTAVTVSLGGTTPTITSAGKLYVSFSYRLDSRTA